MVRFLSVLAIFLLPLAAAQHYTGAPSIAVNVNEADFGVAGDATDNCLLLDMGQTSGAGAQNFDLRITPCIERPYGTEIADADVQEKTDPYPQVGGAGAEQVMYADTNNDGHYSLHDYVYIRTGNGNGLVATSGTGQWTVRLTATEAAHGGFAAGSFVLAADADFIAFGSNAAPWNAASIGWFDADTSIDYTPGDTAYLMPLAAGTAAQTIIPLGSIKLTAAPPASSSSSSATTSSTSVTATGTESSSTSSSISTTAESSGTPHATTPAFGLVGIVVALAFAGAFRRRLT